MIKALSKTAYPWSETGSLCPLLRDPSLWMSVFHSPLRRHALKKATKHCGRTGVIYIDDDEQLGAACLWLLENPLRRRVLNRFLKSTVDREFHTLLFQEYSRKLDVQWPLEAFCSKRSTDRFFVDLAKLKAHLSASPPSKESLPSLLIVLSAFAIFQPKESAQILDVLLEHDLKFAELLCEPRPLPASAAVVPMQPAVVSADDGPLTQEANADTSVARVQDDNGGPGDSYESTEEEPIVPLRVSRSWLQSGQNYAQAYLDAYNILKIRAKAVSDHAATSFPLAVTTGLHALARECLVADENLHRAASDFDAWIDDWIEPLKALIAESAEPIAVSFEGLLSVFRLPRDSSTEMAAVSDQARGCLIEVASKFGEICASLQGYQANIARLLSELELPPPNTKDTSIPDEMVECMQLEERLGKKLTNLMEEYSIAFTDRKSAFLALLESIDTKLLEPNPGIDRELSLITRELLDVKTIGDLAKLMERIELLKESWPSIAPALTLHDLAAKAVEQRGQPEAIVSLVELLAANGKFAEAALLIEMMQQTHSVEMSEVNVESFADLALCCWAGLSTEACVANGWVHHALNGSWVRALKASDLQDPEARMRMAGAFLAIHASNGSEDFMSLFYALNLQNDSIENAYTYLRRLLVFVEGQLPYQMSDGSSEVAIRERREKLQEFFRKQEGGDYVRQAARGNPVAAAERSAIFPELERIANRVSKCCGEGHFAHAEAAVQEVDATAQEVFKDHGLHTESPYYKRQIFGPNGYLAALVALMQDLIKASRGRVTTTTRGPEAVLISEVLKEIRTIAAKDHRFSRFWSAVGAAIAEGNVSRELQEPAALVALLGISPISALPVAYVQRFCALGIHGPARISDLAEILSMLAENDHRETVSQLERSGCFLHALHLLQSADEAVRRNEFTRLEALVSEHRADLIGRLDGLAAEGRSSDNLATLLRSLDQGRFSYVNTEIRRMEDGKAAAISAALEQASERLASLLSRVTGAEARIGASWDGGTGDRLLELTGEICTRIKKLRRRLRESLLDAADFEDADRLVIALEFVVNNRATSFSELEALLSVGGLLPNETSALDPQPRAPDTWGDKDLQLAWDSLSKIYKIPESELMVINRQWRTLVKALSRCSAMYHDTADTLKSFSIDKYPFSRFTTQFYNPRTAFLDRPVAFYLFLKAGDWIDLWTRLRAHLDQSSDYLNVVVVPSGGADLRNRGALETETDPFVVLEAQDAALISGSKLPGAHLRQLLHRGARDLTSIGLFCTDGAVHRRKNLFVGRETAIQQLELEKASAIWGGRRIGKTSLLHALKERLEKNKRWRVAYIYGDVSGPDPDLLLARRVSQSLGLTTPETVDDLGSIISQECKTQSIAVLVDEVDGYIVASRRACGNDRFPFARTLRGIASENPERFKLVYAGFKQLYYEVQVRPNPDPAYPFKNFLKPVKEDFGDFTPQQVEELLNMAFVEMLGISYEPSVPRLVKERTSGHPAFIQALGDRLLQRLERRRRSKSALLVTAADIEAVYHEEPDSMGDHKSYIDYVYETLGWNLSHLGRAIMLALSNDVIAKDYLPAHSFCQNQISNVLASWSDQPQIETLSPDFSNALHFLVMTNMLTRNRKNNIERYRIAYPAYIDFMQKFGDRGGLVVDESLRQYREQEQRRIV